MFYSKNYTFGLPIQSLLGKMDFIRTLVETNLSDERQIVVYS